MVGVRLTGEDLRVCWICFGTAVGGGWDLLREDPVLLPVVPRGTRNDAAHIQDEAATRDEARSRLSGTLATGGDLAAAFTRDVGELIEGLLRRGRDTALPQTAHESSSARTPPRLVMPTASVLALAAIDPDISRMLGLYWHDPVDTGTWDYRVVAHHGPVLYPGRRVSFDALEAGPIRTGMLTHDGIVFVGTAGLEVTAGDPAALRVSAPRIGTVAGMRLDPPVPALSMRVAEGTFMPFTAWHGSARVDSTTGSTTEIHLSHDAGIDAVTWTSGPVDLLEVEVHPDAGRVGDLAAHAWNLSPQHPDPVRDLELTAVASAAEPTRLHPDGAIDRATGVVGLDWAAPHSVQDVHQPLRVLVARAFRGTAAAPVAGPFEVRNSEHPALAFVRSPILPGPRPGPDVPRGWTERALSDGRYAWRVRSVDAFGRLGEWSAEREVDVAPRASPPPPDQVLARYLDPADPHLSAADRARTDADGAGLLVEWTWPVQRRIQAPQVEPQGEFRVLLRRGDPNLLHGNVVGVGGSRLDTDLDWGGAANALAGEFLRLGPMSFEVTGNGTGPDAWIAVRDLTAPSRRPTTGPFTISLSERGNLRVDLGRPATFDQRVHTQPVGPILHARSHVVALRGTTVTLADPLPPTSADPLPGWLVCGGIAYPVTSQTPGSALLEIHGVVQADASTAMPVPGEPCTVWAGASYQAWLSDISIEPEAEAVALALVAVSTSDGDPSVADDPGWSRPGRGGLGGRPGREGMTSRVARITVPRRGPPPPVRVELPPEQDGDIPADQAEPADWFGRAHYSLAFPPVAGAAGYRVLRASTAALFTRDRVQRQSGLGPYPSGPFDDGGASQAWLDEHHPTLSVADLTADLATHPDPSAVQAAWRGWSAWYYPGLSNREVMAMAERAGNEEAFRPAHDGTIATSPYRDTVDGRGLGRFVYRVRSVDASGNDGAWSAAFPLVEVRDVTAPATPVLQSVLSDENAVAITLRAGAEPDLVSYRVWRAERADALVDIRRRPVHAELPATAGRTTELWRDEGLPGLQDWYYRVAAVDAAGNVSAPTAVVKAQPVDTRPPNPPAWILAEWTVDAAGDGVRLMWRADERSLTCVLQRRPLGGGVWKAVSPPIRATASPRDFEFVDRTAVPGVAYDYRVSAQDAAGNPNVDFAIREVRT
jgi:hypothetical protein